MPATIKKTAWIFKIRKRTVYEAFGYPLFPFIKINQPCLLMLYSMTKVCSFLGFIMEYRLS